MSKRLVQVAKELNVGTQTIVDYLNENGFDVSNKPTVKISDEMYGVLAKNFQSSIHIKEKANQITIGTRKKEELSLKERLKLWKKPSKSGDEKTAQDDDIDADDTPIVEKQPVVETTKEVIEPKHQLQGPKILGKINLDDTDSKGKKKVVETEQPAVDKDKKAQQEPVVQKQENKVESTPKEEEVKHKEPVVNETPIKQKEVIIEDKTNETSADSKTDMVSKTTEDSEVDFRMETPQLKGLKILGKINIETKKRKKKGKDNRDKNQSQHNQGNNQQHNNQGQNQNNQGNNQNRQGNNQNRQGNNQGGNNSNNQNNNQNRHQGQNQHGHGGNKGNQNFSNQKSEHQSNKQNPQNQNNNTNNQNKDFKSSDEQNKKKNFVTSSTPTATPTEDAGQQKKRRKRTRVNKTIDVVDDLGIKTEGVGLKKNLKKVVIEDDKKGGKKKNKRKAIDDKEVGLKLKETMNLLGGGGKKKKFGTSRKEKDEQRAERMREIENQDEEAPKLQVTEFISVSELAALMGIAPTDIIMACMREKRMVSINQRMDRDLIELMAIEFGYEVEFISAEDQMEKDYQIEDETEEDTTSRPPIVTVMGHVDHGKTSLLDSIRKANVAGGEAGGITQHIGAYEVTVPGKGNITFLDTPGHEAFTAMRARGAKVTDIAVIIISADDSIMPQTKEAISHAQAAGVPIIFAINKIDKDGANPDKIKQELAGMDLLIEEWGGTYQSQDISAKKGLNIDLLLEKILLEAEMLDLKANPEKRAVGTVLEASLEQGRGYVAKVLVRNGTLNVGDVMVAGSHCGRVKAMFNERGKRVKSAGPACPVLVLGLQGAPQAGETLNVLDSEKEAKDLANKRANLMRQQQIRATRRVTLDDITNRIKIGNFKELNLIVKGDFDGSVEALSDSLLKLSTDQVQTNIIYKAVGPVTESDVNLAAASDALIVGFQVRPNPMAKKLAEKEGVEIKTYSIIYDAIEEIKSALEGMLEPKQVEEIIGQVDVQEVFKISKVGAVAGCLVQEGKVTRNSYVRVIRNGIVEYPKKEGTHGEILSLRRFKDTVSEVKQGFECGITLKNYNEMQPGDILEIYEVKQVKQTL